MALHGRRRSRAGAPAPHTKQKSSRPTRPCDGPRMNPSVDVGNPPRPFRHLRVAERCTPDPSSSRVPVHSALVQKSVTAITNPAGRLSIWMLGKSRALGKWKSVKSWQAACNQSNEWFPNGLASGEVLEGWASLKPLGLERKGGEELRRENQSKAIERLTRTREGLDSTDPLCVYTQDENNRVSERTPLVCRRNAGEVLKRCRNFARPRSRLRQSYCLCTGRC
jgi:hypothetical protein